MLSRDKDPRFVESGRRGARKRWGALRVVRLADLDPTTAEIVRAILAARDHAAKAPDAPAGQG